MFEVKVENNNDSADRPICIMVTHNGYQWSTISVNKKQLKEVKKEINKYLRNTKEEK